MQPRAVLFVGNFFFSMFTALIACILLPFLSGFMPAAYTGLIIALGGIVSISIFPFLPRFVQRYGAQQLTLIFALVEMIVLLGLAIVPNALTGILLVIITMAFQPFLSYQLDLLLEATTASREVTGRVRTVFLTAWNFGSLAAPLLVGALLVNSNEYNRIFLAATAALVPLIVLFTARTLPKGVPPEVSHLRDTICAIARDRDLAAVTFGHFILYLFFIWVPFYVPVYLHNVLEIPWATLGWMFSIALVPYVLVEYPAGWVADRLLGDKEMMLAGFLIAGTALAALSLISPLSSTSLILCILLASRIGAALLESMTEGHFFRRVREQDIGSVSVFRGVWPLANVIAPIIGSAILFFGTYQSFFLLTGGFIVISGVITTSLIRDFR